LVLYFYWTWIGNDETCDHQTNRATVAEELTKAKMSPINAMVQERKLTIRQIWNRLAKILQSGQRAADEVKLDYLEEIKPVATEGAYVCLSASII
jgi:hypothetical protein